MRFLNPKIDAVFREIFGSEASRDIPISFLNAILALSGEEMIADVTILDPRLAPTLLCQLDRRFGPITEVVRSRVAAADLDALDRWLDRVIDAPTLGAVFDD